MFSALVRVEAGSGSVGLKPHRTEVVACREVHVSVQCGGEVPQQWNGGLGAALSDALDLVGRHADALCEVGDAEAKRDPAVVYGLSEGESLSDLCPLRIAGLSLRSRPAGVRASHHACLS